MGNSSGILYSPEYTFQNTDRYDCTEKNGWMLVEVLNEFDDEFWNEFDDEFDDESEDDDLQIYKEVCQLLSDVDVDVDV